MSDPTIIPPAMRRCLRDFVMRRRRVVVLRRLGIAMTITMSGMLVCALVDRLIPLAGGVRLSLMILIAASVVVLLFHPICVILRRRFDWRAAAAQVERRDPRFAGRLETAVSQLLLPAPMRASPQIVRRIAGEADLLAAQSPSSSLVSIAPALRPWLAVIGLALLGAALARSTWMNLPTLLRRELLPLARISAVTTTRIDVEPGDIDVAQDQPCTIVARTQRLGSSALTIRLSSDGREFAAHPMTPLGDDRFSFTLPQINRDWEYDVGGGDARSERYTIRVLRRPGVSQVRVRYIYPGYMNRPPASLLRDDGRLEAPVGTQAVVDLVCTDAVASASLVMGDRRIALHPTNEPNVLQAQVAIVRSEPYEVQLISPRGMQGNAPKNTLINAEPDFAPRVAWIGTPAEICVNPMDRVTLGARASDDYGNSAIDCQVQINQQVPRPYPLAVSNSPKQQACAATLNLADWPVTIGDVIHVWLEARDAAGQVGRSEVASILVAPTSVDDQLGCAVQLGAAAKISQTLADEWGEALHTDAAPAKGSGSFGRNTHLSRCEALADELSAVLLRATSRNRSANLATALAELLDRAAICQVCAHQAASLDESSDPEIKASAMARANRIARGLRSELAPLASGEQARCVRANLLNLQALVERLDSMPPAAAQSLRQTLQGFGERLDDQIAALGFAPDDERLMELLQEKIAPADEWIGWAQPIDWRKTAPGTPAAELSKRLLVASRAEGLRVNADFAQARDLNLAAYATRDWTVDGIRAFVDSLTPLHDPRQTLRQRAGENPELLAFEAAAREQAVAVNPATTQPAGLADEIHAIEKEWDPTDLTPPLSAKIFGALSQASDVLALVRADALVRELEENAIRESPLAAARELSRYPGLTQRRATARACVLAAARAARYQARLHIQGAPGIAEVLDDSRSSEPTVETVQLPKTNGTAPAEPAAAGAAPSGGFDDDVRVYFQMLRKVK